MAKDVRIAITGFMGVGKSSVARHLAQMLKVKRVDLDTAIEKAEHRKIAQIIDTGGEANYRVIETRILKQVLAENEARILSLGGGTWIMRHNRELLAAHGFTSVWLEASFDHCWRNITFGRKDRPLARDKAKTLKLFEDRQKVFSLAEWHFIISPDFTSYDVARKMKDEVFS